MKIQISNGMFMATIINMVYTKSIGLTQGSMAREVGNDIWLATLFAAMQGILVMLITILVIKRIPQSDLLQHGEQLLGKWAAKVCSLIFLVFFLGAFTSAMTTFVYHLKDYFLPEAPVWLFVLVAVLLGIYAIHFGLEVITRMSLVGVFAVIALNILLLAGSLERFDIRELLPIFQVGLLPIVKASRHHTSDWMIATMMAAILLPFVKDSKTWNQSGAAGVIFGCFFVIMWPILETGVMSAEVTAQYIVSCMQMARSAQIGLFIHRYEMIMVAFFALSLLTQIMTILLCATISAQRLLGLKDYRPTIVPVSLLFGGFTYWATADHARAMQLIEGEWVLVALTVGAGIPILFWVIGLFFRKKLEAIQAKQTSS